MTNEQAIAEARRIEQSIEDRIAAGEIPPKPQDRAAHRAWFQQHLQCPAHPYYVRERGAVCCSQCLGFKTTNPSRHAHYVGLDKLPEEPKRVRRVRPA